MGAKSKPEGLSWSPRLRGYCTVPQKAQIALPRSQNGSRTLAKFTGACPVGSLGLTLPPSDILARLSVDASSTSTSTNHKHGEHPPPLLQHILIAKLLFVAKPRVQKRETPLNFSPASNAMKGNHLLTTYQSGSVREQTTRQSISSSKKYSPDSSRRLLPSQTAATSSTASSPNSNLFRPFCEGGRLNFSLFSSVHIPPKKAAESWW
jgi:hypothetical protein